jgi:phosphoglycerate dehydrogenase-like enzyme
LGWYVNLVHGQNVSGQNVSAQNVSATERISNKTYRRQNILATKHIGGQNELATKRSGWFFKKVINKIRSFLDKYSIKNP